MVWPANLTDPSYAPMVLSAVSAGQAEISWAPVTVTGSGQTVTFWLSVRPLRIAGVYVNVSASLQQQIADLLNALLPTPKMMDLAWLARAATLPPVIQPPASTSAAMQAASSKLDSEIETAGNPAGFLIAGKTWAIGNLLVAHPGRALNYGLFCIPNQAGNKYDGITTEACVSITDPTQGRVIQGQGWAHNAEQVDESQLGWFVHRACTVSGASADLGQVLVDPTLAPLVSHEGVLKTLRQPGVPVLAPAPSIKPPSTPPSAAGAIVTAALAVVAGFLLFG